VAWGVKHAVSEWTGPNRHPPVGVEHRRAARERLGRTHCLRYRATRRSVGGRDLGREVLRAQVQGTASIEDDPDGMLIDELSHKYTGGPYPGFAGPNPQWVIVRITADKVTTNWPSS